MRGRGVEQKSARCMVTRSSMTSCQKATGTATNARWIPYWAVLLTARVALGSSAARGEGWAAVASVDSMGLGLNPQRIGGWLYAMCAKRRRRAGARRADREVVGRKDEAGIDIRSLDRFVLSRSRAPASPSTPNRSRASPASAALLFLSLLSPPCLLLSGSQLAGHRFSK